MIIKINIWCKISCHLIDLTFAHRSHNQVQSRNPETHFASWRFYTIVQVCSFRRSDFVAVCMDYSDTPDSWTKRLMDFRRHSSELTALSRVLKRRRRDRSSFHFDMEPIS